MRSTPVIAAAVCAAIAAGALADPGNRSSAGRRRAKPAAPAALVVVVEDSKSDIARVRRILERTAAPVPADETSDPVVLRVPATPRDARRVASRLRGRRGVHVFVNRLRRARGAPTQIPVVEGDLEPRAVRDQPAMDQVGMAAAAAYGTGAGVTVAVLDGGFDLRHEMLEGRIHAALWDAADDDADPQDLGDGVDGDEDGVADRIVGHGTFVASLILAAAPEATILPVRVLDDEGLGTPLAVAQGIRHAIAHGADVINLSLVVPATTDVVRNAVRAAIDAGIVVVSAAGNDGGTSWQSDPFIARNAVTVGAVDQDDRLADFSATGNFVHVYAPGAEILGALGGTHPDDYATWQGTSFSAAIVSGVAAIARSAVPSLTGETFRRAVMTTSADAAAVIPTRRGRLAAAAAMEVLMQ